MIRSAASKVAWVGRTASMVFGLALVLALLFGVASMAFGANGQNFILGVLTNTATDTTRLTGNVAGGPALHVVNGKTEAGSRALHLGVPQGKPPLTVNATAGKATNLNADMLDGMEPGQLPGSVAVTKEIAGRVGAIEPTFEQVWTFFGPTVELTTTTNQRLVGSANLALVQGDSSTPRSIDYGLCYMQDTGEWTDFLFTRNFAGDDFTSAGVTNALTPFSATASVVPGAGKWVVGFCARNKTNGPVAGNAINGWVQVVNE